MAVTNESLQNNAISTRLPSESPISFRPIRTTFPPPKAPIATPILSTPVVTPAPQNTSGAGGVPLELLTINVVQSPAKQQSYTNSEVSVSFSRNPSDTNYDHVDIWFVGYHGSTTPTLMSGGTTSPITFLCDTTGETVTVYAQPIGTTGEFAPLSFALSGTVTLNGVTSAPPQPTITQYVVSTPTGYQFAFDQLVVSGGTTDVVANYNVYRNTSNSTSGATVIRTIKHDPTNNGNAIVVQDIVDRGTVMYYWLSAVNTKGLESALEACQTTSNLTYQPTVAVGNIVSVQSIITSNVTALSQPTSSFTAGNSVYLPGEFSFDVIVNVPGTDMVADVLLWASDTSSYPNAYVFRFDNRSGNNAGYIYGIHNGTGGFVAGTAKASVQASRLPVGIYHVIGDWNQNGLMNIYVNGVWQATLTDTTFTPTGATYYGYELNAPAIAPYIQNWSQFGSGALLAQGSISSGGTNTFAYSSLTTSIKWTWSSFDIYSPDGSTITVPANSTGTTFSGLSSSTTYYFGFYVTMSTGVCTVVKSDVSGGTAMLSTQYITQTLNGDGNCAINFNIAAATTASGSGGGSGGGGGGGTCFTPNARLIDARRLSDIRTGDWVYVEKSNGTFVYRQVSEVIEADYNGEMRHVGEDVWCTPNHQFRVNGEWKPADDIFHETKHYRGKVHNLHIKTDDDEERNYVLWNGMTAHNLKPY